MNGFKKGLEVNETCVQTPVVGSRASWINVIMGSQYSTGAKQTQALLNKVP